MIKIRPATQSDIPVVTAIARIAFAPYVPLLGFEPPPMVQDFQAALNADALWMADHHGYVVARPAQTDWLLENVAVATAGLGLGRKLIHFAEDIGRARGFQRITLYTNVVMVDNQRLYPYLGYVETHRVTENGLSRVYYAKDLHHG